MLQFHGGSPLAIESSVYVSTVVRGAELQNSGEILALDWDAHEVVRRRPIYARNPDIFDPNPRGSTRGGRGIAVGKKRVYVCSYHSVYSYDLQLQDEVQFTHGLMVGLHEVHQRSERSLLLTSTSIDAVLDMDPRDGTINHVYWPREHTEIQKALSVTPLTIDKTADNRTEFLGQQYQASPNHLHLNAVTEWDGRLIALFHRHGVIADIETGEVLVHNKRLRQAHNMVPDKNGLWLCDTRGRAVMHVDLRKGEETQSWSLLQNPTIQTMARRLDLPYKAAGALARMKLRKYPKQRPIWVRGLALQGDYLLVGFSPAAVARLDPTDGEVDKVMQLSNDPRVCTHGLAIRRG